MLRPLGKVDLGTIAIGSLAFLKTSKITKKKTCFIKSYKVQEIVESHNCQRSEDTCHIEEVLINATVTLITQVWFQHRIHVSLNSTEDIVIEQPPKPFLKTLLLGKA